MRKAGFTLVELLVVLAIIALLAAILFPVSAQAREKVRAAVCLSNARQIGMAISLYAEDYDERLPMGGNYFLLVYPLKGGGGESIRGRIAGGGARRYPSSAT